ncbi:MAG: glycosyltransferase family 2 protein [Calditrichaeota bacterium]|nr:glycosyltransferase family 2 protein [Candidatus Cloacimonadota bacterium]MCA9786783.1 glycosyltransferase family 2 protein [Candidatus Cloacimonadota bacterium]MCB1047212.1 glycosyltransferase family 2 protein [Calditrichota bacterium]
MSAAMDMPGGQPRKSRLISIVIVHYNTLELTRACLQSIRTDAAGLDTEVLVVDNGSSDGSGEQLAREFPDVRVLSGGGRLGFAAANNLAAHQSHGDYLLFLNSDTELRNHALQQLLDFMDATPDCAISGCRLLRKDGSLDKACRRSFPTPLVALYKVLGLNALFPRSRHFSRYDLSYLPEDGRYLIDCGVGAFMFCRLPVVKELGFFDEDYFFYGEDIDLCYRVRQRGHSIWYLGDIDILHHKRGTSLKSGTWVMHHFHASMLIFYRKHYRQQYPWFVNWLVYAGVGTRYALVRLLAMVLGRQKG